jgi:xanthosine phosphorylase
MSTIEERRRLVAAAAAEVRRRAPGPFPRAVLMLGSGLGGVADAIEAEAVIPTAELPGFPKLTAPGHAGRLVIGRAGRARVACLQGRAHLYEGHDPADIAAPIRTMKALGATTLIMASAAGGLRPEHTPGSLVVVEDHINLSGRNPLTGPNDDAVGPRFPDMTNAYDPTLRAALAKAGEAEGVALWSGVYLHTPGPSFETPAEIRMFAKLGADLVGMSTVPECIIARHAGLRVAAVAVVTNLAAGISDGPITLEEAIAAGQEASGRLARVLTRFLDDVFGD